MRTFAAIVLTCLTTGCTQAVFQAARGRVVQHGHVTLTAREAVADGGSVRVCVNASAEGVPAADYTLSIVRPKPAPVDASPIAREPVSYLDAAVTHGCTLSGSPVPVLQTDLYQHEPLPAGVDEAVTSFSNQIGLVERHRFAIERQTTIYGHRAELTFHGEPIYAHREDGKPYLYLLLPLTLPLDIAASPLLLTLCEEGDGCW